MKHGLQRTCHGRGLKLSTDEIQACHLSYGITSVKTSLAMLRDIAALGVDLVDEANWSPVTVSFAALDSDEDNRDCEVEGPKLPRRKVPLTATCPLLKAFVDAGGRLPPNDLVETFNCDPMFVPTPRAAPKLLMDLGGNTDYGPAVLRHAGGPTTATEPPRTRETDNPMVPNTHEPSAIPSGLQVDGEP